MSIRHPTAPHLGCGAARVVSGAARAAALAGAGMAALLLGGSAHGQTFQMPPDFEAVPLPSVYSLPVGLVFAPDGHMILLEKAGPVRVLSAAGVPQGAAFIDLTSEVNNDHDRGLLGIALDPAFVADGGATSWVYLLYTVTPIPPADNSFNGGGKYSFSRLTRYKAVTNAGIITADTSSRQVLLGNQLADGSVPDCIASLHNSHSNGSLHFADDGTLMISTGDGAHYDFQDNGGNDNNGFDDVTVGGKKGPTPKIQDEGAFRSQDPRSLSGKLLRINPANGQGYASNPFFDGNLSSNRSKVWAIGLRNPYRMDLVPGTGATDPAAGHPNVVILGDVGWNTWEELNISKFGGENFGWPCYEGFLQQSGYQGYNSGNPNKVTCHTPVTGTLTLPVLSWNHNNPNSMTPTGVHQDSNGNPLPGFGGNCSIGGTVYTGGTYPAEYIGREFFADYAQGYIKTLVLDASYNIVAVRDFASDCGNVVDIERNPATGDLYFTELVTNKVYQIRFNDNLTPVAVANGTPTVGAAPLAVQFSSEGSSDPEGSPLTFDWDFDDGSAHSSEANPLHTYVDDGAYDAKLVVQDLLGLTSEDDVPVFVGNLPPSATILLPAMGSTYDPPQTIQLSALGVDPENGPLTYDWQVDLYHSDHIHFGTYQLTGQQASFDITESAEADELLYHRIELTVTDEGGESTKAHVFIYPQQSLLDASGTARPIAKMQTLFPPNPVGGGNHDIEVIRDKVYPAVGSNVSGTQYDTFHDGEQGTDDWIGYELVTPPDSAFRFTGLQFQEGIHFWDGGWFKDLHVEVRNQGNWSWVTNFSITPEYPFVVSELEFFDQIPFQTYELAFDPVKGDAVRLRGTPGGANTFISVGELRARVIDATPPTDVLDITADGTIVAKLFSLSPPVPLGSGSQDPETIRNGTLPETGSTSALAQYDTFHNGQQGSLDWIGYDFGATRTFRRVQFQEGLNTATGGAFTTLSVQVQQVAAGPWTTVADAVSTPPYTGLNGVSYETFTFDFAPVTGRALRIAGAPAGSSKYISVGELRVFAPAPPPECGFFEYGQGSGGGNTLTLTASTQATLGQPVHIVAAGALPASLGLLGLGTDNATLPLLGGTLLLDPDGLHLYPISYSAIGDLTFAPTLPSDPAFSGLSLFLQVYAFGQGAPNPTRFSNGLKMTMCSP